ncbi:MAG: hypothetical protein ACFFCS_19635 [Candidatus Hodarchaeota archaeon]
MSGDSNTRTTTSREDMGKQVEITDEDREKQILVKQKEVIKRQAEEMREEFQSMREEYVKVVKNGSDEATNRECFKIDHFMELEPDGTPTILNTAIKYFESHEGCPFFKDKCELSENANCKGVWIKMGSPCFHLVKNVKKYIKTVKDINTD